MRERTLGSSTSIRKMGHVFLEWNVHVNFLDYSAFYKRNELIKIHRHFFHPHAERIYELLKQAKDPHATPETLKKLEEITSACDICQRLSLEPGRFRVALPPGKVVFNRLVLLDLMNISGKRLLRVVDHDTGFIAASFLSDGESSKATWETFSAFGSGLIPDFIKKFIVMPDPNLYPWNGKCTCAMPGSKKGSRG